VNSKKLKLAIIAVIILFFSSSLYASIGSEENNTYYIKTTVHGLKLQGDTDTYVKYELCKYALDDNYKIFGKDCKPMGTLGNVYYPVKAVFGPYIDAVNTAEKFTQGTDVFIYFVSIFAGMAVIAECAGAIAIDFVVGSGTAAVETVDASLVIEGTAVNQTVQLSSSLAGAVLMDEANSSLSTLNDYIFKPEVIKKNKVQVISGIDLSNWSPLKKTLMVNNQVLTAGETDFYITEKTVMNSTLIYKMMSTLISQYEKKLAGNGSRPNSPRPKMYRTEATNTNY